MIKRQWKLGGFTMSHRSLKEDHRLVQKLNDSKSEIRLIGLNKLTEYAGDQLDYRDKAIELIQPHL
jgi:hypothetical protein